MKPTGMTDWKVLIFDHRSQRSKVQGLNRIIFGYQSNYWLLILKVVIQPPFTYCRLHDSWLQHWVTITQDLLHFKSSSNRCSRSWISFPRCWSSWSGGASYYMQTAIILKVHLIKTWMLAEITREMAERMPWENGYQKEWRRATRLQDIDQMIKVILCTA